MCTAPSRGTKVNSKKSLVSTTGFRILLNSPSLKIRLYSLLAKFSFQYCHVILFSQQSNSTLIIQTLKVTLHTHADVNKEQSNFKLIVFNRRKQHFEQTQLRRGNDFDNKL